MLIEFLYYLRHLSFKALGLVYSVICFNLGFKKNSNKNRSQNSEVKCTKRRISLVWQDKKYNWKANKE